MNIERERVYDPEAQAIEVMNSQENGSLIRIHQVYAGHETVESCGLEWIQINDTLYLKQDCNIDAIEQLKKGEKLSQIVDFNKYIRLESGEISYPVAALLSEDKLIYKSRGLLQEKR